METIVRQPNTRDEWKQYYHLRWQILRQPWNQPPGSEKDELEDQSIHRIAAIEKNNSLQIIAVARLHYTENNTAQIRYMAVDEHFRLKGIGQKILLSLENTAKKEMVTSIELNARESAVPFYQANQYQIIGPGHLLYDEIRHKKMKKILLPIKNNPA